MGWPGAEPPAQRELASRAPACPDATQAMEKTVLGKTPPRVARIPEATLRLGNVRHSPACNCSSKTRNFAGVLQPRIAETSLPGSSQAAHESASCLTNRALLDHRESDSRSIRPLRCGAAITSGICGTSVVLAAIAGGVLVTHCVGAPSYRSSRHWRLIASMITCGSLNWTMCPLFSATIWVALEDNPKRRRCPASHSG